MSLGPASAAERNRSEMGGQQPDKNKPLKIPFFKKKEAAGEHNFHNSDQDDSYFKELLILFGL